MFNFLVITLIADGPALFRARASASTMMTKFAILIYMNKYIYIYIYGAST